MNKSVKGIAMIAGAMVVVGLVLTGIGFMAGGNQPVYFDESGIHLGGENGFAGGKIESFSEDLESFNSIHTELDYYNVELIPSDKYAIESDYNSKYGKPEFKIENGTLTVKDQKHKRLHFNIDLGGLEFSSGDQKLGVKIYYPKDTELKDLTITGSASNLSFQDLKVEKTEFDLDFGELNLTDISAKTIKVTIDSGDCSLKNITSDELNITNDLGNISLNEGTVGKLTINADSGNVTVDGVTAESGALSLDLGKLTVKDFSSKGLKAEGNSGDMTIEGTLLGMTEINCDMGTVTVRPGGTKDQFDYELETDLGLVRVDETESSGNVSNSNKDADNTLKVTANMGDVSVDFE